VQLARHLGATVIGTASAARHDWLTGLGADQLIDYTSTRFEDAVKDVDVVIDLIGDGHDRTSTRSLDVLRPGGLLVAVPSGGSSELFTTAEVRDLRATSFLVEPDGPALARIAELIDAGDLHVEVEEVFPLAQAARAHARGEAGHTRGKLVLSVS
jgi:NADPH:quinone reductase-like Zn-dependent oxidoreductase